MSPVCSHPSGSIAARVASVVEIAHHHVGAAQQDLAVIAGAQFPPAGISDPDLEARGRAPARA
jgi:hypothetical protein